MSGKRASVVFGTRSVEACIWLGNEHGREEISGGRYRMGWSECMGACLPRLGGSCGSWCGSSSLGTSSDILEAGEDTKLKTGEEVRLVCGDDSDEAEELESGTTRYRLLGTLGDSMWVVGCDYGDKRVFVARADDKASLRTY